MADKAKDAGSHAKRSLEALRRATAKAVSLGEGKVELERAQFKALLLANPNYFGTLPASELPAVTEQFANTKYEQIECVGLIPEFNRLEAVVLVKQDYGYGGDVCSAGSTEYVRFYLSDDGGATWSDQGMAGFVAHDIPGDKPLEYAVSLTIDPDKQPCANLNLVEVRAILSWNQQPPPDQPGFQPAWGDVKEATVQIAPTFSLIDLIDISKISQALKGSLKLIEPITVPAPALSATELVGLYADTEVPLHRALFRDAKAVLTTDLEASTNEGATRAFIDSLPSKGLSKGLSKGPSTGTAAPTLTSFLTDLDIDLADLIATLFETDGNTDYEELTCVGLDPNLRTLVASLTLKLSSGYSGDLCSHGSYEYVAFWVDWDDGAGWTYAGTSTVNVHDIAPVPPGGVQYAVSLPVDLSGRQQPCEIGPRTARVRAILSWQASPPPDDPDHVPTWGNRAETLIEIPPGPLVEGGDHTPFLSSVGRMPESIISSQGVATGWAFGFAANSSPFGGRIDISGHIAHPVAGLKYRVMRKPHLAPDSAYVPMTNEPDPLVLVLNTFDGTAWHQNPSYQVHADADGYYPFEDYAWFRSVEGDVMARWYSSALEDGQAYDLRIDVSVDGNPANDLHSNVVTVLVDNSVPEVELDFDGITVGVDCADFEAGATFTGTYEATDDHFRSFAFVIRPGGPAHGVLPAPPSRSWTGGSDTGDPAGSTFSLDTTGMDPCGYSLTVRVWDRTNVDSGSRTHYNESSVGFCLRES